MSERQSGQLTPAAELALSEYLTDIREEILWRAMQLGGSFYGDGDISVRDVLEATDQVVGGTRREPSHSRRSDLLLRLYLALSAVMALVGALVVIAPRLEDVTPTSRVGLTLIATGASAATFAFVIRAWLVDRLARRDARGLMISMDVGELQLAEFVRSYAELELDLRDAVARYAGESASNVSLSELIRVAHDLGLLPSAAVDKFRSLTHVRNRVVHGRGESPQDLRATMRELEDLRRALQHTP